jgi:hypothetical protein
VNGKGYKKWKRYVNYSVMSNGQQNVVKQGRHSEVYIYRGTLKDCRIEGTGEFKWPDGRHYIGEFINSQM